ncbi:CRISPR-associated protein Cas4 [Halorutilales archaeon Cl-col2-1]
MISERELTGQHYHYYTICKTKLWYHHYRILYADENEYVKLGELLDSDSFKREDTKNIGNNQIDFIRKGDKIEINEVKRSSTYQDADEIQLIHYMHLLHSEKETEVVGILRYPEESTKKEMDWSEDIQKRHDEVTKNIREIIEGDCPDPEWKTACKKCSMREFCFA